MTIYDSECDCDYRLWLGFPIAIGIISLTLEAVSPQRALAIGPDAPLRVP